MNHRAVKLILASQLVFLFGLVVCAVIDPLAVRNNWPISHYGSQPSTIVPFAFGLLGASYLLYIASLRLNKRLAINEKLSRVLVALATLPIGVVLTPVHLGKYTWIGHAVFTISWFFIQLVAGFWLVAKTQDRISMLLLGIQVFGQGLAVLSLKEVNILHLSAAGQLLAITAFAILLMRSVLIVEDEKLDSFL